MAQVIKRILMKLSRRIENKWRRGHENGFDQNYSQHV